MRRRAGRGQAPGKLDFGLTECEVVRLAGPFDRVEISDAQGVRVVTMTSTKGARPGIYRFEAGRLKSVEGAPEPEKKKGKATPAMNMCRVVPGIKGLSPRARAEGARPGDRFQDGGLFRMTIPALA